MSKLTKQDLRDFELTVEYDIDLPNRRLYLINDIDEVSSALLLKGLHYLDQKAGPIQIMINCNGGNVTDTYAIYDSIRSCNNKTITIGTGVVASAAGLLLVCGDERYATPNCRFMAHEGSINLEDEGHSPTALAAYLKEDMSLTDLWCEQMAAHTEHSKKWWVDNTVIPKKDLWFNLDQMIKHGIVDGQWPTQR